MIMKMAAIMAIEIHAPARNLVTTTRISTNPVMHRPNPLMVRERIIRWRTCGSRSVRSSRFQCRSMPVWDSVKETNTPTM